MLTTTMNQGETLPKLDAPVRCIVVDGGKVLVTTPHIKEPDDDTPPSESVVVGGGAKINFDPPVAGIVLHDIVGSRVTIVYADDPPDSVPDFDDTAGVEPKLRSERRGKRRASRKAAPAKAAPRGDTGGGETGGFESRTVKQLRAEAKKRGLKLSSRASKGALIKTLRKHG